MVFSVKAKLRYAVLVLWHFAVLDIAQFLEPDWPEFKFQLCHLTNLATLDKLLNLKLPLFSPG